MQDGHVGVALEDLRVRADQVEVEVGQDLVRVVAADRAEDDADLGVGAVVLPGARIGRGAQVGAGAVVAGEVAPNTVVAGVPARPLRPRG